MVGGKGGLVETLVCNVYVVVPGLAAKGRTIVTAGCRCGFSPGGQRQAFPIVSYSCPGGLDFLSCLCACWKQGQKEGVKTDCVQLVVISSVAVLTVF